MHKGGILNYSFEAMYALCFIVKLFIIIGFIIFEIYLRHFPSINYNQITFVVVTAHSIFRSFKNAYFYYEVFFSAPSTSNFTLVMYVYVYIYSFSSDLIFYPKMIYL